MEGVLSLTRSASNALASGKFGQKPFRAQYCACFSAINPPMSEHADESRISLMVLKKNISPAAQEDFRKFRSRIEEVITHDFGQRLLTRTANMLPTLLANIKTFKEAARTVIKGARASDQIAPMLAGLYSLHSTGLIDLDRAIEWVEAQNWEFHTNIKNDTDPTRLIHHISTSVVRIARDGINKEAAIGELVVAALGKDEAVSKTTARDVLRQYSIIATPNGVTIGNRNQNLSRLLKDTPWCIGWARTMSDIPGAVAVDGVKFGAGDKQRGVRVPITLFYDGYIQAELEGAA
jgi:hypothetical protein